MRPPLTFLSGSLPSRYGEFTARAYRSLLDGTEHVVLVAGQVEGAEACLVRVQSESLLGDVFGSLHCNSGSQLDTALRQIAEEVGRRGFEMLRRMDPWVPLVGYMCRS